jgi:outer membrane protein
MSSLNLLSMLRLILASGLSILAFPLLAQGPLTLQDAVRQALGHHPSLEAASARIKAAETRRAQAASGYMPQIQYQESFQAGNNPVYVFSSLLSERQFTEANFEIHSLNHPDPAVNFQSLVTVDQSLWDGGATKQSIRAAELGRAVTEEERRRLEMSVAAGVARSYHAVTLSAEGLKVAEEALKSAQADLQRAETVRAAGMATDADVLAIQVHLSAVKEVHIRRRADLEIALAALNEALGLPLDTPHELTTPLTVAAATTEPESTYETQAATTRPEIRMTELSRQIADAQAGVARAAYMPQFALRGAFEADRQDFIKDGGASWFFMASLRWNVFDGKRSREAVKEAKFMSESAGFEHKKAQNGVRLEVRKAHADLRSAQERIAVTDATIAQADEGLRILRNRYSNGLANVTELLRAETALLEARTRRLAAVYDQRMAAVALEQAAGTLNGDSYALQ